MRRKLAVAAAVTAVVLGVLVTRAVWEGRRALADGDDAAKRGDTAGAIDRWATAARWYVPFAPHVDDAYARLRHVAEVAETRADGLDALAAWRAIHSAAVATRWLVTPHQADREVADAHIAKLEAAQPIAGVAPTGDDSDPTFRSSPDAGKTADEREAFYLRQLGHDGPSVPWTIAALVGFGLWIGGAVHFARRGLDAGDRVVRRAAASAGGMVAVGIAVWAIALYNA